MLRDLGAGQMALGTLLGSARPIHPRFKDSAVLRLKLGVSHQKVTVATLAVVFWASPA